MLSQAEPLPRKLARVIARFTSAADVRSNGIDCARGGDADLPHQGRATIPVAAHAPETMVGKLVGDAIEIGVILHCEAGPLARERATGSAGLAAPDIIGRCVHDRRKPFVNFVPSSKSSAGPAHRLDT